ncbi:MAG: aldo/keto reductase [Candidatus Aminicenantes bacterium]|nr:aldo/keto reductase [Candidatus Aminicenantes bacterium]
MSKWSRRRFLTTLPTGVLGIGLAKAGDASAFSSLPAGEETELRIKKYNPLGKTGLKVSDISCGAISFFEPNVMRYAADLGVNYFDTAEGYMNTNSESYIGQALSGIRDKVFIATKHAYNPRQRISRQNIIQRVEASLKRLQTDHVDMALIHNVADLRLLENQELQAAYSQLKTQGKIRFTGFSTHNAPVTLKQALNSDFADVIMVIYNHLPEQSRPVDDLVRQVRDKGIGVIAIKIFAGGKQGSLQSFVNKQTSYSQAAIRWVMSNPSIDCCIPTMSSYAHVEEYVSASGQTLETGDSALMTAYRKEVNNLYCRVGCSVCGEACPHGVAVNDILRFNMYFDDYKMEKEAMRYYAELEEPHKPLPCSSCSGPCTQSCPYGLPVRDRLLQAKETLSP